MSSTLQQIKNEKKEDVGGEKKCTVKQQQQQPHQFSRSNSAPTHSNPSNEKAKKIAILNSEALNRISNNYSSSDEEMPTSSPSKSVAYKPKVQAANASNNEHAAGDKKNNANRQQDDLIQSYKEREEKKGIKRKRKFTVEGGFWSTGKVSVSLGMAIPIVTN